MRGILSTGGQNMKLLKKRGPNFFPRASRCKPVSNCSSWRRYPAEDRTVQFFIIWALFLAVIVFGAISSLNKDKEDNEPAPIKETIRKFFY